jgi:hypothetical protein
MRRVLVLVAAVAIAVSALTACNDDVKVASDDTTSSTSSTVPGESTTSTSAAGAPAECPANTDDQSAAIAKPRAELVAVRAAHQPGFDRVVLEFTGAAPGFRAGYIKKPVTEDASGEVVPMDSPYVMQVVMENSAAYRFDGDDSFQTYTGPKRFKPADTTVVQELVNNGDFEGYLTWAIGVKEKVGFRLRQLADPPRLQIEFCARP